MLLLTGFLTLAPAFAHLPEQYGRDYLRVIPDNYQPPQNPDRSRRPRLPGEDEIAVDARLREEEAAAGAYGSGLADPLTNLSSLQLERGRVDDAARSLRRAIQLVRINNGLYSESQVPLLRRLIRLYQEVGDYAALSEVYGYYYRVIIDSIPPVTPQQLPRLTEYLDWERQLYASRSDGGERVQLLRLYQSNQYLLDQAELAAPSVYVSLAMSQLRNLYLILGESPLDMYSGASSPDINREIKTLAAIQRTAQGKGRRLLLDCLARLEGAPPRQLAQIYLQLGDWELWNEHLRKAQDAYARVAELMQAAGAQSELASWFDEPVELPNMRDLWPLLHEVNGEEPVLVEASFEVNSRGEARRVEVSAAHEEAGWQAGRVRGMIRDSHFRPRVGPDGFESGPRVTRHYRLVNTH